MRGVLRMLIGVNSSFGAGEFVNTRAVVGGRAD